MGKDNWILFMRKPGPGGKRETYGRLHVGWRKSDWTKVWYQPNPEANVDDDGTTDVLLFQNTHGPPQRRAPMEGEVDWLSQFDWKTQESDTKKEKQRLQAQFLYDAWRYLNEKDVDTITTLETELDDPLRRRWQSFFDDAKVWKEARLKRHSKKRAEARKLMEGVGLDPDDHEVGSDTDEDSAYETEPEAKQRKEAARKRKAPKTPEDQKGPNRSKGTPKRPGPKNAKRTRPAESPRMSGGMGSSGAGHAGRIDFSGSPGPFGLSFSDYSGGEVNGANASDSGALE